METVKTLGENIPLFSIIIPTRNHALLLKTAIKSVLNQKSDDIEVIVSDNASTDNTLSTVRKFKDQRLRYIRTDHVLTYAKHWDFAGGHAAGKYLLWLADDDALVPGWADNILTLVAENSPRIITWGYVNYRPPSSDRESGLIENADFTGQLYQLSGRSVVYKSFQYYGLADKMNDPETTYPFRFHPSVICIIRSVFEKMLNEYGFFFVDPIADTGYLLAFYEVDTFYHLDLPLSVIGLDPSTGGRLLSTELSNKIWNETDKDYVHVPLHGLYHSNAAAESHLRLFAVATDHLGLSEIYPREKYYINYYLQMIKQSSFNQRFDHDYRQFMDKIKELNQDEQETILNAINAIKDSVNQSNNYSSNIYKNLKNTLFGRILRSLKRMIINRKKNNNWIRGKDVGVYSLLSCAEWTARSIMNFSDD